MPESGMPYLLDNLPGGADRHKDAVGGVLKKFHSHISTMKCNALFLAFVFCTTLAQSQNLVPNPSFEEYTTCAQQPCRQY